MPSFQKIQYSRSNSIRVPGWCRFRHQLRRASTENESERERRATGEGATRSVVVRSHTRGRGQQGSDTDECERSGGGARDGNGLVAA